MALPQCSPLAPVLHRKPFDDPRYVFELKLDGFRGLAYVADGTAWLVSRRQNTYRRFDSLAAAIANIVHPHEAILDGEICCVDDIGRPVFRQLLFRRGTPVFLAFDTTASALPARWKFFATSPLQFRPGTQWSYSNSNFLLLGAIIERQTGRAWVIGFSTGR